MKTISKNNLELLIKASAIKDAIYCFRLEIGNGNISTFATSSNKAFISNVCVTDVVEKDLVADFGVFDGVIKMLATFDKYEALKLSVKNNDTLTIRSNHNKYKHIAVGTLPTGSIASGVLKDETKKYTSEIIFDVEEIANIVRVLHAARRSWFFDVITFEQRGDNIFGVFDYITKFRKNENKIELKLGTGTLERNISFNAHFFANVLDVYKKVGVNIVLKINYDGLLNVHVENKDASFVADYYLVECETK